MAPDSPPAEATADRVRRVERRPATEHEWQELHAASPHATYFESPAWARVWQRYTDGRITPAPVLYRFGDGARAVAPWSRRRRRLGADLTLAAPAGTYGGWLYDPADGLGPHHLKVLAHELGDGPIVFRQNPFDPALRGVAPADGWTRADFTQALDLADFEPIDDALRKNQVYRKHRQGEAAGLSIRAGRGEDISSYFRVYQAARERWGEDASSAYRRSLFEAFDLDADDVDFWIIERDGAVIGGGPFLRAGTRHVVSWLTLADPDHFDARPYDFAYVELIRHYRDAGVRWFDFNPSGGHEGVVRFKDNFGPRRLASNVFRRLPLRDRLGVALRTFIGKDSGSS